MKTFTSIHKIKNELKGISGIGFIPTMGYLHEGHLSLIKRAKELKTTIVASIFVNPSQFSKGEDFEKYPRNIKRDEALLEQAGVDYLFLPEIKEIYPDHFLTEVTVKDFSDMLCGHFRPGHFSGVCTVVLKLLNIIKPELLFLGRKDYQQTVIIKKMLSDLNMDIQTIVCPTMRDETGLALSSRNSYLSADEKIKAVSLYKALSAGKNMIQDGTIDTKSIIEAMKNNLSLFNSIDYAAVIDEENFQQPAALEKNKSYTLLAAAWIGKTRLIDNISTKD